SARRCAWCSTWTRWWAAISKRASPASRRLWRRKNERAQRPARQLLARARVPAPGSARVRGLGATPGQGPVVRRPDRPVEAAGAGDGFPRRRARARHRRADGRTGEEPGRMTLGDNKRWLALYLLCAGELMIVLDTTIVN